MNSAIAESPMHCTSPQEVRRSRRRLLMISYHFPPVGGAGVQRPLKFAQYLSEFGWDVTVLMAKNPSVPVLDHSLRNQIPAHVRVEQARTFEPGYRIKQAGFGRTNDQSYNPISIVKRIGGTAIRNVGRRLLLPDPQILWLPHASRVGSRLIHEVGFDAILATAPPYSNLLLGARLKRKHGLPLVVDYRDEWDLSQQYLENCPRDRISRFIHSQMQKHVLAQADALIATTPSSTQRVLARAEQFGYTPSSRCIYNGFDPADFEHIPRCFSSEQDTNHRYRLVYTGTLWNLTNVEPLIQAIEHLHDHSPKLLKHLELHFVGRKTAEQSAILNRLLGTHVRLRLDDYCDHAQAIEQMATADGLCLLLSDGEGADRVVPAKLFEYLATRRELLAIAPQGETSAIVRQFFPDHCFQPSQISDISEWLQERLAIFERSCNQTQRHDRFTNVITRDSDIQQFSRRSQAGDLAELLEEVVTG